MFQADTTAQNTLVSAGDPAWHDYDLHVKATKKAGQEGFLVAFGVKDTGTYYLWNIGGWNNTQTAVEQAVDGGKSTLIAKPGSVDTGRAYDIDIKVRGRQVTLYLDGQQWGSFTDDKPAEPFRQVVTRDAKTGELIVKVVNDQSSAARSGHRPGRCEDLPRGEGDHARRRTGRGEQRDVHGGRTADVPSPESRTSSPTPSRRTRSRS